MVGHLLQLGAMGRGPMGQVASVRCRHRCGSSTAVVDSRRGRCCCWWRRRGRHIGGGGGETAVENAQGLQQTQREAWGVYCFGVLLSLQSERRTVGMQGQKDVHEQSQELGRQTSEPGMSISQNPPP